MVDKTILEEELKRIDQDIETMEKAIELAECLKDLQDNKSFKKLIEERFIDQEKQRITDMIVYTNNLDSGTLELLDQKLLGVRHFVQFLNQIENDGAIAGMQLEELKEHRVKVVANPENYFPSMDEEE